MTGQSSRQRGKIVCTTEPRFFKVSGLIVLSGWIPAGAGDVLLVGQFYSLISIKKLDRATKLLGDKKNPPLIYAVAYAVS